jgi:hypothetical protein
MSEVFLIIKEFSLNNSDLVTWTIAGLILALGFVSQRLWIREYVYEWKFNHFLNNIGHESLHNISIADDMDEKIFVEHLILTSNSILLLGVKKYQGLIFAADEISLWTQVIGNKSYKFENPLRQLENDALVLNSKLEKSKLDVKVLFVSGSEFPKGKPDNVIFISDVKKLNVDVEEKNIPQLLRDDWQRLSELAVSNDLIKDKDVLIDVDSVSGLNVFPLISVTTVLLLWLVWRLM